MSFAPQEAGSGKICLVETTLLVWYLVGIDDYLKWIFA